MTLKDHFLLICLAIISLLLLSVWPIPHTIGIRNILLGVGFFIALYFLWRNRWNLSWKKSFAAVFILIFFLWLIFHYLFISTDQVAQIKELQSTWLRAFLAGCIAFSMAIVLPKKMIWRLCIYLGVLMPVIIYFYSYVQLIILTNEVLHYGFTGLIGHKIVLGYTGISFVAITLGVFSYWLNLYQVFNLERAIAASIFILGIVLSLTSFVLINTRNGIGVFLILMILWILFYLSKCVALKKYLLAITFLLLMIPVGGYAIYKHFSMNMHQWRPLLADIKVGYQIDKFDHWQSHTKGLPQNELGIVVNLSTYERTAWATAGLRYLSQNPMGAGLLGDSFRRMAAKDGIESHSLRFTHSGWIDLTLAVGIPGILLLILSILASLYWAMEHQTEMASVTVWLLIAIALYWLFAELATNKHFVEMLIFMLVFLGTVNAYDQSGLDDSFDESRVLT